MPNRFHPGEIAVQQRAGVFDPSEMQDNGIANTIDPRQEQFLRERTWAIIGAADSKGNLWASPLHGSRGFLSVRNSGRLQVQAQPSTSDPLASAFERETNAGLLILDPATRRRLRLNGRARENGQGGLSIVPSEVYGNCPKYIQRREPVCASSAEPGLAQRESTLTLDARRFISAADTFFIATMNSDSGADASHRGGNPGFVRVLDERRLAFPDYAGNNMFQSLGNLQTDPRVGLLFLDFETGATLQLSGNAEVHWDPVRIATWPGAQRIVEIEVEQAVKIARGFPLRFRLVEASAFNPSNLIAQN